MNKEHEYWTNNMVDIVERNEIEIVSKAMGNYRCDYETKLVALIRHRLDIEGKKHTSSNHGMVIHIDSEDYHCVYGIDIGNRRIVAEFAVEAEGRLNILGLGPALDLREINGDMIDKGYGAGLDLRGDKVLYIGQESYRGIRNNNTDLGYVVDSLMDSIETVKKRLVKG